MKVLGIVVEYNPFHNGHEYHLKKAKEIVNPDFTIAVMSGNFCQRGEPAIISKFARAEIALRSGIDVVFELPFVFAVQDAGGFAKGAIWILKSTNVVTDIVFGSESGDLDFLKKVAEVLIKQPEPFPVLMREELKKGFSFPNARKNALRRYFEFSGELNPLEVSKIEKSNDILGLEYVRSAMELNFKVNFHTVKRVGAEDRDEDFKGKFSSATAVRKQILAGNWDKVAESVPTVSYEIIKREIESGRGPVTLEDMEKMILSVLRLSDRQTLSRFYGFSEGIEKRFLDCSYKTTNLKDFFNCVKSKRFTLSKIRRLSLYAFFGITQEFLESCNQLGPQYLRILGFTEKGRKILSVIKKKANLPIITNCADYKKVIERCLKDEDKRFSISPDLFEKQILLDIKSTAIYNLLFTKQSERKGDEDFKATPTIV
ncbi:nucleotidyltransferase [Pseudothermotoga thermarum]|uniref:tRNA(Met) cytidine acetate ligase n=1 Tax=Pseudothermotoga thermarum DSM 5069 TaxID=688269 RepID=F7YY25_9THEM|nr:nucleotidyltransferase [Pseudothermotoga thermarum]AEH50835.1 protein of unknown function DUF795 [Pseudothermotoga thermarum DSM 5069]